MTPDQVMKAERALGPPLHSDLQFDESIRESRAITLPRLSYGAGGLDTIEGDHETIGVRFEELDVFVDDPEVVVRRLYDRNGGALAGGGDLLFLKLGINTGGFLDLATGRFKRHDDDQDEYRTLAVFAPGMFDALLEDMRPIALPPPR
jgi:hypothetical protein